MKQVKFTTTDRKGKLALWADDHNIWDLKKSEFTRSVREAIVSAFEVGCEMQKEEYDKVEELDMEYSRKMWTHVKEERNE